MAQANLAIVDKGKAGTKSFSKPLLPQALQSLLSNPCRDGRKLDEKQRAWIEAKAIPMFEDGLSPATSDWTRGRIAALLAHFFVPGMDKPLADAVLDDWCAILAEQPAWSIDAAAKAWLGTQGSRKPLPGDILAICEKLTGEARDELSALRDLAALPDDSLAGRLKSKLDAAAIKAWISPLRTETTDDGRTIIRAPKPFIRDWVAGRYRQHLVEVIPGPFLILLEGEDIPAPAKPTDMAAIRATVRRIGAENEGAEDVPAH